MKGKREARGKGRVPPRDKLKKPAAVEQRRNSRGLTSH